MPGAKSPCSSLARGLVTRERQRAGGAKELDARALSALGYERLENLQLLEPINALYGSAWPLYHNHFCPSVKLVEKRRDGARQIKRTTNPRQLTSGCWKEVCSMRKSALPLSRLLLQLFVIITASFLIGRLFTRCGHNVDFAHYRFMECTAIFEIPPVNWPSTAVKASIAVEAKK